jgi:hypothetical protein
MSWEDLRYKKPYHCSRRDLKGHRVAQADDLSFFEVRKSR